MIEVHNLIKRYGHKPVLKKLDFSANQGEFVALLGPNGAGKTTFLRILSTLAKPNFGSVTISGFQLPNQSAHIRQRLGVVSHQPLLYGDLSAEENLKFFSRLYGLHPAKDRIAEILKLIGLEKRKFDLVRTYSRGMQQRLAIGRAILHDPEVLLLDEPHTGLDQDASNILDGILNQVAMRGRTVVMTSHDLGRVANLASRFDVLTRGFIQASINIKDLPKHGLLEYYQDVLANSDEKVKAHAS
ncbi:MAG: heme ABC exporter, ATP-binding protein CcmA [Chloroflexi bacterium 44-23]|nr:MAG: heme ABC exporter, ATP-binding protein CcmA [Chloroflexi bacterium 44-23]